MNFAKQPNGFANHNGLIPPNNYLWQSPDGIAYPGWHHQLILHIAAQKQSAWSNPNFTDVKARLRQYPEYAMDDKSLKAVIEEYLQLNLQTRWAYRDMDLSVPPTRNQPSIDVGMDFDWESIIDPALFDHSERSSTPTQDSDSSPLSPSPSSIGTHYSEVFGKPIVRNLIEEESPVNPLRSTSDRGSRRLGNRNIASPVTPTELMPVPTPSTPYPDRFRPEQC